MVSKEVSVFAEVLRVSSAGDAVDPSAAVGKLCVKDLEEIRKLHQPCAVVRRTFEVMFLLLNLPKDDSRPIPPTWQRIQRMLSDMSFLTRMKAYDVNALRSLPAVAAFIAEEYFGAPGAGGPDGRQGAVAGNGALRRRSTGEVSRTASRRAASPATLSRRTSTVLLRAGRSTVLEEPLTYQRVFRASHAAGALFSWCAATIEEAINPSEMSPASPLPTPPPTPPTSPPKTPPAAASPAAAPAPVVVPAPAPTPAPAPAPAPEPEPKSPFRARHGDIPLAPPPPPPPPQPKRPAHLGPDRHFEQISVFKLGYSEITPEGEMALQLIAATMCMRQQLVLQLQGALHPMENPAMVTTRQRYIEAFFDSNKLRYKASEQPIKEIGMNDDPGIICQLILDNDRELRDWFIMRDEGEAFKVGANTKCVIESLESEFKTVKH